MTDTLDQSSETGTPQPADDGSRMRLMRVAVTAACALLGFLLVAQVRATEDLGDRLAAEREEDLALILSDLSEQSDRLQREITDLRLLLFDFESSAESEELALANLEKRYADMRVLAGIGMAEGEGITLTIEDPGAHVGQDFLVDAIQELRDAGAEAIAVNGVRLVAQSAFTTRNERLLIDGQPMESPYRIAALGEGDTLAAGLSIPGGVVDTASSLPEVVPTVEILAQLRVPARTEPVPFVFAQPVPPDDESG